MSLISEPPVAINETRLSRETASALRACSDCRAAAGCRIAACLGRLGRIREQMTPSEDNAWLRTRIDEYMGVEVCLAGLLGMNDSPAAATHRPHLRHRPGEGVRA